MEAILDVEPRFACVLLRSARDFQQYQQKINVINGLEICRNTLQTRPVLNRYFRSIDKLTKIKKRRHYQFYFAYYTVLFVQQN